MKWEVTVQSYEHVTVEADTEEEALEKGEEESQYDEAHSAAKLEDD